MQTLQHCAQGIYNRPGMKWENGPLEEAPPIIDRFSLVDKNFAQFFLLDERSIYFAHENAKLKILTIYCLKKDN